MSLRPPFMDDSWNNFYIVSSLALGRGIGWLISDQHRLVSTVTQLYRPVINNKKKKTNL